MMPKRRMSDMGFSGFPNEGLTFLAGLALNNDRAWFSAHKADYKDHVEGPAKCLLEALTPILSDLTGQPMGGKIFRIHRDVRFSKDKTPYNTHVRMAFYPVEMAKGDCGAKPAFFLSLEPDKVITGAGSMDFPKPVLEAYRGAVNEEKRGKALVSLLRKYKAENGFRIDEPALKRVPKDYDPEHPRGALLRHKALSVWHEEGIPTALHTGKAVAGLMRHYKKLKPVYDWLDAL
jgi:uncharacterized protein (TIGR02453 family)